jgi:pilus assembly protein CpaF
MGQTPSGKNGHGVADELFQALYLEVVDSLDTTGIKQLDPRELRKRVSELVSEALRVQRASISPQQRDRVVNAITDEILGLGPLEVLLADPTVSDIMVNTHQCVFVERNGVIEETDVSFRSERHLLNTINRIVTQVGRRVDEASPMVDARLPDGSRVNAIIPPLAVDGAILSIRRFGTGPVSLKELVTRRTCPAEMAHYFKAAVRSRCNILICGGTGAGKTTLLNALSRYIPSRERIVTIEDSAELQLQSRHVARLETRPPNIEGKGCVTIRDLLRNALRMRPDRIIIGEVRSAEALDMIQAMNTGHEGSMTTIHANNVEDAVTRLMSMLAMAGTQLSEAMMLQMITRAIDVVVHVARGRDGRRQVTEVAELAGVSCHQVPPPAPPDYRGQVELNALFALDGRSGGWSCSGYSLLQNRFEDAGCPLDPRWLRGAR